MGALGVTHEGELAEEVVEQQLAGGRDLLRGRPYRDRRQGEALHRLVQQPGCLVVAVARILAACRKAGKRAAIHAGSTDHAAQMAGFGFNLVTVWVDVVASASSLAAADEVWAQQADPPMSRSPPRGWSTGWTAWRCLALAADAAACGRSCGARRIWQRSGCWKRMRSVI
jgi:hypothetical protein